MSEIPAAQSSAADIFYGIQAQGKNQLKKHLDGKTLTRGQALLAKCYECMSGYVDGRVDCEIPDCPLYQYMPYKK